MRKWLDVCDVLGGCRIFVKLLKTRLNLFLNHFQFVLWLFSAYKCFRTTFNFDLTKSHCVTLGHSENPNRNCRIVCYSNVTDFMCIYCHYRLVRTHSSLNMSKFQKIYDFMIWVTSRHLRSYNTKKKLRSNNYVHHNIVFNQNLHILSDLSPSEL